MSDATEPILKGNEFSLDDMEENEKKNPYQFGTEQRKNRDIGNKIADTAKEGLEKQKWDKATDELSGKTDPEKKKVDTVQANKNYKEKGVVSDKVDLPMNDPETAKKQAETLRSNELHNKLNPEGVANAAKEDQKGRKNYAESFMPGEDRPEKEAMERQEQAKKYFSRLSTLRDIGVEALGGTAEALKAADKQYDSLIKLTGAMMSGKPMSVASQALATTMTGFGSIGDVIDNEKKNLGVKPGVDPAKLKDQLAIKGAGYYRDMDNAVAMERHINNTFNQAVEEAAKGKDLTQLTDAELKQVHDRLNEALKDDYERVRMKPKDQWNAEDKAFYQAYKSIENGIGKRAKQIGQDYRSQIRGAKDQQAQAQDTLDQNMGAWYRSGQMKTEDIGRYQRQIESKMKLGQPLTADERKDYDDIMLNYGWQGSVKNLGMNMTRSPYLIPLWTQKAGTKMFKNMGGDEAITQMYDLARKGDIDGLKALLDSPAKTTAAMGFARLGIANQSNSTIKQKFPMSNDDVVLSYAIDSAVSGRPFNPPVRPDAEFKDPKWLMDKRELDAKREQQEREKEEKAKRIATADLNAKNATNVDNTGAKPVTLKQNPSGDPDTFEEVSEVVEEPEVSQNAGKLRYTASNGASEYQLKTQEANLLKKINLMSPDDPQYRETANLYNAAVGESVLAVIAGDPSYTDRDRQICRDFIDAAGKGLFTQHMTIDQMGGRTAKQRAKAWFGPKNAGNNENKGNPGSSGPKFTENPKTQEELDAKKQVENERLEARKTAIDDAVAKMNGSKFAGRKIDDILGELETEDDFNALREEVDSEIADMKGRKGDITSLNDIVGGSNQDIEKVIDTIDVYLEALKRIKFYLEGGTDLETEEPEEETPVEEVKRKTNHRKTSKRRTLQEKTGAGSDEMDTTGKKGGAKVPQELYDKWKESFTGMKLQDFAEKYALDALKQQVGYTVPKKDAVKHYKDEYNKAVEEGKALFKDMEEMTRLNAMTAKGSKPNTSKRLSWSEGGKGRSMSLTEEEQEVLGRGKKT